MLPLTLAWKLTLNASSDDLSANDIIAFLTHHEFHAAATEDTIDSFPIISVSNSSCQMRLMKASYLGANRDMIREMAAANELVIFIYRGKVYREQPVLLIVSDHIWTRFLHNIGLAGRESPVLAVVAPAECEADRLPWAQLP
jgi:hypothetical protein